MGTSGISALLRGVVVAGEPKGESVAQHGGRKIKTQTLVPRPHISAAGATLSRSVEDQYLISL